MLGISSNSWPFRECSAVSHVWQNIGLLVWIAGMFNAKKHRHVVKRKSGRPAAEERKGVERRHRLN